MKPSGASFPKGPRRFPGPVRLVGQSGPFWAASSPRADSNNKLRLSRALPNSEQKPGPNHGEPGVPVRRNSSDRSISTEKFVWDSQERGLGQRFRPGCTPVWIVQWRQDGRTVRRHLGEVGQLAPDQARIAAQRVRREHPTAGPARHRSICFRDFAAQVLIDCRNRWKPSTLRAHAGQVKVNLVPHFGGISIAEISRTDVANWRATPIGRCDRALAVLSAIFKHAEHLGLRPFGSNPCAGMRRRKSTFKANYPSESDYRKIGRELTKADLCRPTLSAFVRFLALTGTRRGQAMQLRWNHIEKARAVLPDSKSGPCTIWLAGPSLALLARLPRNGPNAYVFGDSNRPKLERQVDIFWQSLRLKVGLPGLRLHDLRHGFASTALTNGQQLRVVGSLLGHRDLNTTLAYAHLAERPVVEAAAQVSECLGEYLNLGRCHN